MGIGLGEALRAALWRSRWVLLIGIVTGTAAVMGLKYAAGPEYRSTSQVLISNRDLGALITGVSSGVADPQRRQETELALAGSTELYERVAQATQLRLGDGAALRSAVTVTGSPTDNIIGFDATASTAGEATELANAVANGYVDWRAEVAAAPIRAAIAQIEERIAARPSASLSDRLDTLQVLDTLTDGGVEVVQPALQAQKTRPAPLRDGLQGLAIGLVAALVVVALREFLGTTIRSEEEAEDALGAPVLAAVPTLPRGNSLITSAKGRAFADSYSLLAADLENRFLRGESLAIAVTSAQPSEGKSTTTANLAITLSKRGLRVAVLDADVRRPTLARLFAVPPGTPTIQDLAAGAATLDDVLNRIDIGPEAAPVLSGAPSDDRLGRSAPTGARHLCLMSAARGGPQDGDLRARDLAPSILELRKQFDCILIDTPPALAVSGVADLAPHLDGILVVVRLGTSSQRALREVRRRQPGWRAPILGVVVTGGQPRPGYGYGY